mgnify:CR=1 FL=1
MGNMMSLNISDEVIKAAVQEEVHAGNQTRTYQM